MTGDVLRRRVGEAGADRGSVALMLAIITVGMLALAGLVIDGGAMLAARGQAAELAAQAARAGASAITADSLRNNSPSELRIDPAAARAAAQRVLDASGATGQITITQTSTTHEVGPNGDIGAGPSVTVTARASRPATLLAAIGITRLTGQATATATPLAGTTTPRTP